MYVFIHLVCVPNQKCLIADGDELGLLWKESDYSIIGNKRRKHETVAVQTGRSAHVLGCVIFPCRFLASALYPLKVRSQSFLTPISSGSQSCRPWVSRHTSALPVASASQFYKEDKLEKHALWNQNSAIRAPGMSSHKLWTLKKKRQSVKWA